MDPHPPFDHPHHLRAHHYPDQHRHRYADQHLAGGMDGGAAPAGSRYDYDSRPFQYLPSDHQHHLPRIHHQPPPPLPPPPPHHRHDAALPLRAPPETYSSPPYHSLSPHHPPLQYLPSDHQHHLPSIHHQPPLPSHHRHDAALPLRAPPATYSPPLYHSLSPHHHYHQQCHGGDNLRAAAEIRRFPSRYHHHQPQLPWEEAEEERRRSATLQLRLSPPDSRKRHRCALHDSGDLESTSSSGPLPRRQRQHLHTSYSLDEDFVDRTASNPGYRRYEGFVMHSGNMGNRKMQTSTSTMLPDSPKKLDAGYPRRALQKSAPARVSVWQRIEEYPSVYTPSSPHQLPNEVHISPSKSKNLGYVPKELVSVIPLDCKAISPSKTKSNGSASKELASMVSLDHKTKSVDCKNSGDNGATKKSAGKKSETVLASVLVKPSPKSKEKQMAVKQATRKSDKVQNNVPGFINGNAGLSSCPGAGVKKVKKIVIKKIVRKIGTRNKQMSTSVIPKQMDSVDANANASEKEEGEITTPSFEKDDSSAHNLISTSDTAAVGSSVVAEKEQNDFLINPCKSNAASAIESVSILDISSASGSKHPEKEDGKDFMNRDVINATSVADSTKLLDTIGGGHPGDKGFMDSVDHNSAHLCENGDSHMEEDGMAVPGPINVVVDCNSPKMPDTMKLHEYDVPKAMPGSNDACKNVVKDAAKQVLENADDRRENSNALLVPNGEGDRFTNNSFRSPSTDEASVTVCIDVHRKEGSEICVASLGDSIGTSKIAEPSMIQGTQKEKGNMLTSPRDKGVSVSSRGTLNSIEPSVNEGIQDKDGRIPMELSKANASITHHVNARDGLEGSFNEDIQEKECITSVELRESTTAVAHHEKAPNTLRFSMNENIQKNESQTPIDSNALKTTQHREVPNIESFTNKVVGRELCRSHMDSDETHVHALDNSIDAPDTISAGGTKDSHTQGLLHDQRITLDKLDLHREATDTEFSDFPLAKNVESLIMLLGGDCLEDSSGPIILNNDVGKDTISQAAEPMRLHRADLSLANNLSLLHSCDSPSVSDNSDHSPTALTLGNNTYFSSAENGQPEENHILMGSGKGLDDVTATELGKIEKGKSESGNDLIKADAQNWLTLPLAVNFMNNDATVSMEKFDLEQNVDEGTSVSQDHGSMPDMGQCGSIDAFNDQDCGLKQSCSSVSQSDLLALKERNKNIKNESETVLPESSVCSLNILDQYGYHTNTIDKPIDNTNKPVTLSSQSAGMTGGELASSQVYVDPGHTYDSDTMDPVLESSTKPDLLSSWMEATVSEATKEHQPCKSTSYTLFGPKKDTRMTLSDPQVNSALKSTPRTNSASSTVTKVPTKLVALSSPSRLNQNARHRTWYRDNVSSNKSYLNASQPSGLPPKLPLKKNAKTQNCYIRKGNALIRNPATGNHPQSSSDLDAPSKLSKPVMRRSMNFVRKGYSNDTVVHPNISVERPKTPPLPLHTKSVTTNISEPFSQPLQKQQVPETEKKDHSGQVNMVVDNPSVSSVQKSEPLDAGKLVYVRQKSNQLVASQGQQPSDSISGLIDKALLLQPSTTADLYFKKKKNQIILGSSTSDVSISKEMSQAENSNTALKTTNTVGSFSYVWTLSGQHPQGKSFVGTSHVKAFPRILPWKRKVFSHNYRSNYCSLLTTSSLGIVRKLLRKRKRGTMYTVSTNGFSLRKSGLLSFDGSSLKWSRSLEKGSQKVNEEAALAVAEIDRKKRERRKSLRNKGRNDQYSLPVAATNGNHTSSDSSVPSTCNEYVRINKGNQLVRNPKKVIRMLASEKVRWSLHTVRSRLAKKQQYCQFFTRFGACKKSGGKCPYIHDRAKVAICTKFLKGLCSNANCKLTHKVLPERMPDCSYFLGGLCSNTTCPYRHVKVNRNAPVCEDFLKGYCADGDECRKKHSYVCPVFEATGECPQQSRCKLHHPKKKIKSKRSRVDTLQNNSWGRYYDTSIGEGSEAMTVCSEEEDKQKLEHATSRDFADFIDLGADIDGSVDVDASDDIHMMELDPRNLKMQAGNLDALIKPLRIMRTPRA